MAKKLLDFDLTSGLSYYTEEAEEKLIVGSYQDCEPLLDHCKRVANAGLKDQGIKEGWWHYCYLPHGVALEMIKKGINPYPRNSDKEGWRRFFQEINTNYPALKVTHKHHH
jgi:hypothetical protein